MSDTFTDNILGVSDVINSSTNKVAKSAGFEVEGVTGEKIDILDLPMTDTELLKLRNEWEKQYGPYEKGIQKIWKRNLKSYLGKETVDALLDENAVTAANLQFEAEETFLPAALSQDPSPFVYADNSEMGNKISDDVQTMLQFHADQLLLRRKLALMVRQWSIYHLGVLKVGWNSDINDVSLENRRIQDFIFQKDGYVDAYGDFVGYLGERITVTADKLIELFPKHRDYIEQEATGDNGVKLGTEVTYTEWWNDDYCFTTFKEKVLDKHKNEYFKYAEDKGEIDEMGQPKLTEPRNHFAVPKKPYVFLSVFSLQERPHDVTGLIEQNIPNQKRISRQTDQIDFNISSSNNGYAFSENNFNQETGKQAANARRVGNPILVPQGGPIGEAIVPLPALPIPNAFFDSLENHKNDLRSSWGTQGITSQQQKSDTTARGMILNEQRDTSRIGGGIGDVVEQSVARNVFNWLVQLYMVFYDEKHFGAVMGQGKATEYVQLSSQDITIQLIVGVSQNSMKPKDQMAKVQEAQELYKGGAIGPKTLLETLDFPNPDDAAADGTLWQVDKMAYMNLNFPEMMQKLQAYQQQQMQMQQQAVAQQQAQEGQQFQQKQGMEQASHAQKMQQNQETHQQKLKHQEETVSAKLAQTQLPK